MPHTPSTFRGEPGNYDVDWEEIAALHHPGDGGLLSELTAMRHGRLADLVRYVALLTVDERKTLEISLSGDHRLTPREIMKLYERPDFPHAD